MRQQLSVLFSHGKHSQATPTAAAPTRRPRCRCLTPRRAWSRRRRRRHRSSTHTCSARAGSTRPAWASPASPCPSSTRPSMATIRHGGPDGAAARRGQWVVPRDCLRWSQRANPMARHRCAGVHRVSEQLHAPGQSVVGQRPARDDVRVPGAAHGRQRARAGLRQPGDVRVQQLADRRVRSDRHTAVGHGQRLRELLLGDLNATNVVEDSQIATSGRFYTYAFWAQDDSS